MRAQIDPRACDAACADAGPSTVARARRCDRSSRGLPWRPRSWRPRSLPRTSSARGTNTRLPADREPAPLRRRAASTGRGCRRRSWRPPGRSRGSPRTRRRSSRWSRAGGSRRRRDRGRRPGRGSARSCTPAACRRRAAEAAILKPVASVAMQKECAIASCRIACSTVAPKVPPSSSSMRDIVARSKGTPSRAKPSSCRCSGSPCPTFWRITCAASDAVAIVPSSRSLGRGVVTTAVLPASSSKSLYFARAVTTTRIPPR